MFDRLEEVDGISLVSAKPFEEESPSQTIKGTVLSFTVDWRCYLYAEVFANRETNPEDRLVIRCVPEPAIQTNMFFALLYHNNPAGFTEKGGCIYSGGEFSNAESAKAFAKD